MIDGSNLIIEKIKEESLKFQGLSYEVSKVIVGQQENINSVLIAILSSGHILLEGVPGVAKTTMIKAITKALGLKFNRIQFTPDLLPSDVVGTLIYNPKTQDFETKFGPIFANLVLADEINRAPAKVQSALLEAMQEHQVTIGSNTYGLDEPFLVFATQNPIEQEGTYRLPEAQLDRFLFKLLIGYPTKDQEKKIVLNSFNIENVGQVLTKEDIFNAQSLVEQVHMDDKVTDYIVNLVFATRMPDEFNLQKIKPFIQYGVSPRATLALNKASRAQAFLRKRHFVTPDDVKFVLPAIFRHRILLTYEAEAEEINTEYIIQKILEKVPSP
ncbi:MAG: ATPase associated with various cellular activity [candidate division TM6 bacterium GW2011_GWF2_30_66]|nr:MAG: ATPase associated with various cellular activity [candidate division TM6 bacterium GW2011_GWF2_30_66]